MIVKCTKCHHEAQAVDEILDCDWCGAPMEKISDDYMDRPLPEALELDIKYRRWREGYE